MHPELLDAATILFCIFLFGWTDYSNIMYEETIHPKPDATTIDSFFLPFKGQL
jgi:hypothetical protein